MTGSTGGDEDIYGGARVVPVRFVRTSPLGPGVGLAFRGGAGTDDVRALLLWHRRLANDEQARDYFAWMMSCPERWSGWSMQVMVLGPAAFDEAIAVEAAMSGAEFLG